MDSADLIWGGLLVAGAAFEAYALRNGRDGDTLSETTRRFFRVRTKTGRAIFLATWLGFAAWFTFHIVL